MRLFYTDHFVLPLPAHHHFPMAKYRLLRDRVVAEGLVSPDDLQIPEAATEDELRRAHDGDYVRRVLAGELSPAEIRRIGFPWSPELVERSRRSAGATMAACRYALETGTVAANLAGGTHHAFRDCGEGYCVFNDSAIAARAMQAEGRAGQIAVLDCDVHQGNGTAAILAGDPTVFTFSIHGQKNFPLRKFPSDLDLELPDGVEDDAYLELLEAGVRQSLARTQPELVIYLAGADPYAEDRLGRMRLSKRGLAQRDRLVLGLCRDGGIPVAIAMAGGYSRDVTDIVDIHFQTLKTADALWGS